MYAINIKKLHKMPVIYFEGVACFPREKFLLFYGLPVGMFIHACGKEK